MPKVLATDLNRDKLTVVEAEIHSSGRTEVKAIYSYAVPFLSIAPEAATVESGVTPEQSEDDKTGFDSAFDEIQGLPTNAIEEIKRQLPDHDYSVGVIQSPTIISNIISLPFDDKKKIDQVAPVQLQDVLPFDPEGFLTNNQILGQNKSGEFDILTTMIPQTDLVENITLYNQLSLNPKVLTPKASALIPLKAAFHEDLGESFILLAFSSNCCSIITYIKGQLKVCLDMQFDASSSQSQNNLSILVKTLTAKALRDEETSYPACYTIGAPFDLSQLASLLAIETRPLSLENIIDCNLENVREFDNYAWAAGLLLHESQKKKSGEIINFRKGQFAFEPILDRFITSIKDEAPYLIVTALVLLLWVGGLVYFKTSKLDAINSAISEKIAAGLSNEEIAPGQEAIILNDKILTLKQQLGSLGSLSSTATLEALKTLSTAIDPSIGIKIDTLTISHSKTDAQSKLTIDGSVADIPKAGTLQEALKKQKQVFCKVDFQSKGQISGSSRVGFSTTISLCD